MSLIQNIDQDFKQALKEKDEIKLSTLRMLKSALQNQSIASKRQAMTEDDVLSVIQRELKKRRDSIAAFEAANRHDLADKEKTEAAILSAYLPEMLAEADIIKIIEAVMATGANANNFGQVMKAVMAKTKGRADGQTIQRLVKSKLGI